MEEEEEGVTNTYFHVSFCRTPTSLPRLVTFQLLLSLLSVVYLFFASNVNVSLDKES